MPEFVIRQIPTRQDNYVYLAHDPSTGKTAVIDPSDAEPVRKVLAETGWKLTHILNTHHHNDHIGGDAELKAEWNAIIVGPRADRDRIPGIDVEVGDHDTYTVGTQTAQVFDVPGHTRGHIAFWFPESRALFCGDTIFMLGCGRLFEGTPEQMWTSIGKLRVLPKDTRVFCAHEYTQANARFAITVDPENGALADRKIRIDAMRAEGKSTVPATLGEELETNPFLRADQPSVQQAAGIPGDAVATFAEIRRRKDHF